MNLSKHRSDKGFILEEFTLEGCHQADIYHVYTGMDFNHGPGIPDVVTDNLVIECKNWDVWTQVYPSSIRREVLTRFIRHPDKKKVLVTTNREFLLDANREAMPGVDVILLGPALDKVQLHQLIRRLKELEHPSTPDILPDNSPIIDVISEHLNTPTKACPPAGSCLQTPNDPPYYT